MSTVPKHQFTFEEYLAKERVAEGKSEYYRGQIFAIAGGSPRHNTPIDLESLIWRAFERLLCEAFARDGYEVNHSGRAGADGGVDIRLSKAGVMTLVQCKHWKTMQVGVKVVCEMRGLVTHEHAKRGVIVASGTFSSDAIALASRNPILLSTEAS